MAELIKIDQDRLEVLLPLTAKVILAKYKKDFQQLHLLLEGSKFSTGGCGDCNGRKLHSIIAKWNNKYKGKENIKIKEVMETPNLNTFKLKKAHPRVLIPGTSNVITNERSKDSLVLFYFNKIKDNPTELARVKLFFEKLPDEMVAPKEVKIEKKVKKTTKKK